jgi:hypothetical protein
MNSMIQDTEGNTSSKRIMGVATFAFAFILALLDVLGVGASTNTVPLVNAFIIAGTTLLVGGTAAEQIKNLGGK